VLAEDEASAVRLDLTMTEAYPVISEAYQPCALGIMHDKHARPQSIVGSSLSPGKKMNSWIPDYRWTMELHAD
jgi:hypothetical protein